MRPRLVGIAGLVDGQVIVDSGGRLYEIEASAIPPDRVLAILDLMNGQRTATEVARDARVEPAFVLALTNTVDSVGLLADSEPALARSALDVLFELEDLSNELLYQSIYQNPFWKHLLESPEQVPLNVFYGMVIENYHFLFRESYFDAPALNFPGSTSARTLMNKFYCEEYGHDELLLKALMSIGLTREDMSQAIPLPQTMALCNALALWARYEPLFFFSTLGVLEGRDITVDSFVQACEQRGLPESFVGPIRAHSNINMEGEHGSLTRAMFEHLAPVDPQSARLMRERTRLFVRLYDNFYTGIWNYYGMDNKLVRKLADYM